MAIEIKFDNEYINSWDGVLALAEVNRLGSDDAVGSIEKAAAYAGFIERAVINLDEVKESLGGGSKAPFESVMSAVMEAFGSSESRELKN